MKYRIVLLLLAVCLCSAQVSSAEEWPQDARDVAFAIAAKVTGRQGLSNIAFAPETEATIEGGQNGFYAPFETGGIALVEYRNEGAGSSYNADLTGVLNLRDSYGRFVALQFVAAYRVEGSAIRINKCVVGTASPVTVPVEVYLMRSTVFNEQIPDEAKGDWEAMYRFVRENAFDPAKDEPENTNYCVVSFVKSRLPDDANFEAIVGARKSARRSKDNMAKKYQVHLNYLGWRVNVFMAKFKPLSIIGRFYINYYYTPGTGVPDSERDRIHVARYDTKPSGPPPAVKQAPLPASQQAAPAPVQPKPLAQSAPALAPAPQPVAKAAPAPAPVQQPAPIPTPAPQPVQQSAPAPVQQVAPAPAQPVVQAAPTQPQEGPLERGISFLNPIFPDDIGLIQQRLKDLGRYGGPVDKTYSPATKRSLDNFAVENGFPKGQWSLGLQKVLFKGTGM